MTTQRATNSLSSGKKVVFGGALVIFLTAAIASIGYGVDEVQSTRAKPVVELASAEVRALQILALEKDFALGLADGDVVQQALSRLLKDILAIKTRVPASQAQGLDDATQALQSFASSLGALISEAPAERRYESVQQNFDRLIDSVNHGLSRVRSAYQAAIDEQSAELQNFMLLAACLALVFATGTSIAIDIINVRSLHTVINSARRIAAGDLSERVETFRRDEVGQLQEAMSEMSQSLRELVGHIQGGVSQLSDSAKALSLAARQSEHDIKLQMAETDQVAAAMTQMAVSFQGVANHAETAVSSALSADQQTSLGLMVVSEGRDRVTLLADSMQTAIHSMDILVRNSDSIISMVGVIKSVAERTNLLALNAAIEAARAGEHGRGFAVVAGEVRALAQRTQQSTQDIESTINTLLDSTEHAVTCIHGSQALLKETLSDSERTVESFGVIVGAVSSIHERNQQIAHASREQRTVAQDITRNVTRIRDITEKNSSTATTTAASSQQLEELSNVLRSAAARFQL
jgi:methyl-accepting chemotaxis protein